MPTHSGPNIVDNGLVLVVDNFDTNNSLNSNLFFSFKDENFNKLKRSLKGVTNFDGSNLDFNNIDISNSSFINSINSSPKTTIKGSDINSFEIIKNSSWSVNMWVNITSPALQIYNTANNNESYLRKKNSVIASIHSYEKKSFNGRILITKRGPYYKNYEGHKYKYKFEPFAFCLVVRNSAVGVETFITDYKFFNNTFYLFTISYDKVQNEIKFFINGEQQTMAQLHGQYHLHGFRNSVGKKLSTNTPHLYEQQTGRETLGKSHQLPIHPNFKNFFGETATCTYVNEISTNNLRNPFFIKRVITSPSKYDLCRNEEKLVNPFNKVGNIYIYNKVISSKDMENLYIQLSSRFLTS